MPDSKPQDAIALLKADHRKVEELFEQFEKASGDGRKEKIALQICAELTVHAQIEEEIFYPACEGKVEEDLIKEAYVEHDGAKVLIAEIENGRSHPTISMRLRSRCSRSRLSIHAEEEEKRLEGMFSQARKAGLDMEALGKKLAARKQQLMAEIEATGLEKPTLTTMGGVTV